MLLSYEFWYALIRNNNDVYQKLITIRTDNVNNNYFNEYFQTKLQQYLMPSIYNLVQDYISKPDEDRRISQIYTNLAHITQTQFGISPEYQDDGITPYYAAVACLKSSMLSILPSRKIHAIVSAAHCVFKKLNELSILEHSRPPGAGIYLTNKEA